MILVMTLLMATGVSANQVGNEYKFNLNELSSEDIQFLNTFQKVLPEFDFDDDGNLILKSSMNEIKKEYQLTDNEILKLDKVMKLASSLGPVSEHTLQTEDNFISPMVHYDGGLLYFTNADVDALLFAAASIGPAAVYAVLVGLGSVAGPFGTALVAAVGILGIASLANFTYLIIQAHYAGQGVYIGIQMNGVWPNIVQGVW